MKKLLIALAMLPLTQGVASAQNAPTGDAAAGKALWADELRCRLVSRRTDGAVEPLIPLEGVRIARHRMYVSHDKARSELGYEPASVREALERAVKWYRDNGYSTS